jgi:hypothetical protein
LLSIIYEKFIHFQKAVDKKDSAFHVLFTNFNFPWQKQNGVEGTCLGEKARGKF